MKDKFVILISLLVIITGCTKDNQMIEVGFGTSVYHPGFLWSKADTSFVEKEIEFEFSNDAIIDKCYATFQLTDLNGAVLNMNKEKLEFYVNDEKKENGKFRIISDSSENPQEIVLKFRYLPGAKNELHKGYIELIQNDHTLDRFGDQILTPSMNVRILKWSVDSKVVHNPLFLILISIALFILFALLLWLIILRPIFYPVFSSYRKQVIIKDKAMYSLDFKGYREVVFTNKKIPQSILSKIFTGKKLYLVDSEFSNVITLKPKGKGKAIGISAGGIYSITPNPIPKVGGAKIINKRTKQEISLN